MNGSVNQMTNTDVGSDESYLQKIESLPDIMTAKEIAQFMDVSKSTIYEWMKVHPDAGGIRVKVLGRSKRVYKQDFIKWFKAV